MLSKTLQEGLGRFEIGGKLRRLRLRKKMGLVELGRHTTLSPALLSKIETGKIVPTLPTLMRIAMVFSVGLDFFFSREDSRRPVAVVRRRDRQRFPDEAGSKRAAYHFESLDYPAVEKRFNTYLAQFHAVGESDSRRHAHEGAELVYVLRGNLGVTIRGEENLLGEGDAVYFDSGLPHSYRRVGRGPCEAVVVTAP